MIVIKYIILFCIIILSTYIGIIKSQNYVLRIERLRKIEAALIMFKTNLEFTHEPIKNIFEEISKVIYGGSENIFLNSIKLNGNFFKDWTNSINEIEINLKKEDKDIIILFGRMLGKTDIRGQINELNLTETLIKKQIEIAENEKNKNAKLYKSIGIISGLTICIILM